MITPVKLIRRVREKQGFTLAEVVIAATVFTFVTVIGMTVFVNVMRIQRRVILENAINEDGRFMIERIAREIRQNTIDYEEYYRADEGSFMHGQKFGCYAQRFYNPGTPPFLGALCNNATPAELAPGCVINKNTLDINTGENSYTGYLGNDERSANAFCDEPEHGATPPDCDPANTNAMHKQSELYLIDSGGTQKTYIGRKKVSVAPAPDEYSVAMLRLIGQDTDQDGINEEWVNDAGAPNMDYSTFCAAGYDCNANLEDLTLNLAGTYNAAHGSYLGFVPLTPMRTNVTSLNFYVSPLEDPRKAYAETDPADGIQQQPHVTVVMTLRPAESEMAAYGGTAPTVTLQTTITSRSYNEVQSYLGRDAC